MKMNSKSGTHMIDLLFTLALFCVFAASALLVVLIGASVYKNTVEQMDESFSNRTSLTYVTNKVRQNDVAGGVYLSKLEGKDALVLEQTVDTDVYQTWIYHDEGALKELFVSSESEIHLADGQAIIEVPGFKFEQSDSVLYISSVDKDGAEIRQQITLRCS